MKSKSNVFVFFVGVNDAGTLNGKDECSVIIFLNAYIFLLNVRNT